MRASRSLTVVCICVVLCSLVVGLFSSVPSSIVSAAGKMQILSTSTESNFRKNFIFRAKAKSEGSKIVSAAVIVRERGLRHGERLRVEKFEPAEELDLEYVMETQNLTTPPWQVLYYQWELTDEAGNKFVSDEQESEYADNTRDWQHIDGDGVSFYWYDQPESFAKEMLHSAELGYQHVSAATGYQPPYTIRVVLMNSQADYCTFWAIYECKDWYAANTFNTITVQYLIKGQLDFVQYEVIPHELAHAFLHARLQGRVFGIPNWFNEGQAVNNELAPIDRYLARVRELAQSGQLERLQFMEAQATITQDRLDRVDDWYATSTSLVAFLYERFGTDILGKIVDGIDGDKNFEEAFKAATGWTLDEYEIEWRKWLGLTDPPPTLLPTETMPAFFASPTFAPTKTPKP